MKRNDHLRHNHHQQLNLLPLLILLPNQILTPPFSNHPTHNTIPKNQPYPLPPKSPTFCKDVIFLHSFGLSELPKSSSSTWKCPMSSFNRKCTLLSQYLKEKGGFSFGGLSLGMNSKPFLTGGCGSVVLPRTGTGQIKSMDLFPQVSDKEEILKPIVADNTSAQKAETAQMTIFYAGQVVVFDDFPADKAKEVMLLAARSSSEFCPASFVTPVFPREEAVKVRDEPVPVILPVPRTPKPVTCDLPLARRNSLHRFLEKRKDRITTRAPYPKINSKITSIGSPLSKGEPVEESNKSWLSLSAHCH